jgi:hypothetical protein
VGSFENAPRQACGGNTPLLEEGWLRDQEKRCEATLLRADGREAQARQREASGRSLTLKVSGVSDLPVRSIKGGFATFLLLSRPPLLTEEGNSLPKTFQKTPVPNFVPFCGYLNLPYDRRRAPLVSWTYSPRSTREHPHWSSRTGILQSAQGQEL